MASNWKTIEGVTFRFILEEVNDQDRHGCRLLYLASLYLQVRGSSRMHLVRRSRIPRLGGPSRTGCAFRPGRRLPPD
jgi:hypothetical protein